MDVDEEQQHIDIHLRKRQMSNASEFHAPSPGSHADSGDKSITHTLGITRRLLPGPRRIHTRNSPQLLLPSDSEGDLGAQALDSKASSFSDQEGQGSFNLARTRNRLIQVPRRPAPSRDHSPIFQQALAQLFSPSRETPSTPITPATEEDSSPSIIGLGISSDRMWHGLGISDHTDEELPDGADETLIQSSFTPAATTASHESL
jgi:hypothetical protein